MSTHGPRNPRLASPEARQVPPVSPGPSNPRPRSEAAHRVQSYARDAEMLDQVARFLAAGLDLGESVLVIATTPHVDGLRQRLGERAAGVRFLDAAATLAQFTTADGIDGARFEATVGEAVRTATQGGRVRVRAFGEMVALLSAQGRIAGAIELERLWNRLVGGLPLTLLCADPTSAFPGPGGTNEARAVCAEHDHVDAVGDALLGADDGRQRGPQLQRQAAALGKPDLRDAEALMQRERQQAIVARIGHLALQSLPLDTFFDRVAREVADGLASDTCLLLERVPGEPSMALRASHGLQAPRGSRVEADDGTHADYILRSGHPVVYQDLRAETRFRATPLLLAEGVRSGLSVVVPTSHGGWGAIGAHMRSLRAFNADDVNFLEAVAHVLGSAIERRQAEQELQRSRDHLEALVRERTQRLEHANRELDAFSSAVSHDLRGPVRAIAGFSALLAQRHAGRLDPHGRELLEEVRRAVGRMGDLIEDLLDLSRADRAMPQRAPVDLSALARAILREEAERNPARSVRVEVEDDLLVHGDPDLLRMALENLLSNAWKFTARVPEPRITVSKRREGEEIVLCVQDNGAGFDMADAGRLFQPFERLHRRSDFDGTGIGLATVRRIIERHGGRIWVQAKPGAGAAFYFTLPAST